MYREVKGDDKECELTQIGPTEVYASIVFALFHAVTS